jgi:hypothetical protein
VHLVGPLVGDLDTHLLQPRQHDRQRHRLADVEQLESRLARTRVRGGVEAQRDVPLAVQPLELQEVGDRSRRGQVFLVGLRERMPVDPRQPARGLLAALLHQRVGEVVVPRAGGDGQLPLDLPLVDIGHALLTVDPYDEVQPREDGVRHQRRVVDALPVERPEQDALHLLAHLRRVAVAR